MFNWRKFALQAASDISGRKIFKNLELLKKMEYETPEMLNRHQKVTLSKLLIHSFTNVPYYHKILDEAEVIKGGKVYLENFQRIPVLTKDIIRREGENLYSKDYKQRHFYYNSSGGSTGEPVRLIQGRKYKDWVLAFPHYFNLMADKDPGQPEIKLWGSERDIFMGSEKIRTRINRWLFNITLLNSFRMTPEIMDEYARIWDKTSPRVVETYTSSIFEFARHLKRTGRTVFRPAAVICAAETLTEDVRSFVEQVIGAPVLNKYGSREVGAIACECLKKEGLHIFPINNKIEVLDDSLKPVAAGQMGEIFITTLNNYAMPLIRYKIGDTAVLPVCEKCSCGRVWPLIAKITGRRTDHFKTKKGELIHGEYFTHLFYGRENITRFQVIQRDYDRIEILVICRRQMDDSDRSDIEDKIRLVMGKDCKVFFHQADDIAPTSSGKYRYTISEVT